MVLAIAAIVVAVELLYFERDRLPDGLVGVGPTVEDDLERVEHDLDERKEDLQTLEDAVEQIEVSGGEPEEGDE
ncbi:MAG: hypothetical protein ABEJ76_09040 [Halanaeroarchaeum sp.]